MNIITEALKAEQRIRKFIRETPLEFSPFLSRSSGCNVFLKLENLQITNSFKLRGALNKLLSFEDKDKKLEFITASSGNHGSAFAYSLNLLGLKGEIFLPTYTSTAKIEALKMYNVNLHFYGDDCVDTEIYAREVARKRGAIYVSPYNDELIIAGQATIAIELLKQIPKIDLIFVPVGGGGLISGIASYVKSIDSSIQIIGCQPENSPTMYESIKAGKIVDIVSKPTLSDGTAGGIEPDSITFELCKKFVDDFVLVSEEEIKAGIKFILEKHFQLIEGAAALGIASFFKKKREFKGKNVVIILSGGKISVELLKKIIN